MHSTQPDPLIPGVGHPAIHSLDQINKAALGARALVRQILAFGRHQPKELVNRPIHPIVQESLAMLRSSMPSGIELRAVLWEEPLRVMMDATQIQQVLINLCTNAWHALPDATGTIIVGLERVGVAGARSAPAHSGPYALLYVKDDGSGMADVERLLWSALATS